MQRPGGHTSAPVEVDLGQLGMGQGVRRSGAEAQVVGDRIQCFQCEPSMASEVKGCNKCTSCLRQRSQRRSGESRERREVKLTPKLTVEDEVPPSF